MRLGFAVSALVHAALLLVGFLLANARPMEAVPTEAVTVDIVPESEVAEKPKEQLKIDLPEIKMTDNSEQKEKAQEESKPAPTQQTTDNTRGKDAGSEQAKSSAPTQSTAAPTQKAAAKPASQAAAAAQQQQQPAPEKPAQPPQPPPPESPAQPTATQPDPFAPDATATPLYLPVIPSMDSFAANFGQAFDAPADTAAKLSREEITAFQTHLQKCWRPPAGVADADKLSARLRISLRRNGALAGEPLLVSASASAQGPALVQAASRALRQCAPYSFLPADKYEEWKVLDLSFSPRGLAGG